MSTAEWEQTYKLAWDAYCSWEHVETIMRRAAAMDNSVRKIDG